jgi:hypothetical protein
MMKSMVQSTRDLTCILNLLASASAMHLIAGKLASPAASTMMVRIQLRFVCRLVARRAIVRVLLG